MKRLDLWFQSELPIAIDTELSWYNALCKVAATVNELVDAYNKIDVSNIYGPDNPPPYPVVSVNGETGAVNLTIENIPDGVSETELEAAKTDLQTYVGTQLKPITDKQAQLENQQNATAANVTNALASITKLQKTVSIMSASDFDSNKANANTWYNDGTRIVLAYKADSYTDETYIADIYGVAKLGQSETASVYKLDASQVLILEQNVFDDYSTDNKKALYQNHVRLCVVKDPNGGNVLYAIDADGNSLPIGGSGGEGGAVLSVNGKVGNVVITAASIGAALDTELESAEQRIESLEDWHTEADPQIKQAQQDATAAKTAAEAAQATADKAYSADNPPPYPAAPVQSVNSKTGVVNLTAQDVNALPATHISSSSPNYTVSELTVFSQGQLVVPDINPEQSKTGFIKLYSFKSSNENASGPVEIITFTRNSQTTTKLIIYMRSVNNEGIDINVTSFAFMGETKHEYTLVKTEKNLWELYILRTAYNNMNVIQINKSSFFTTKSGVNIGIEFSGELVDNLPEGLETKTPENWNGKYNLVQSVNNKIGNVNVSELLDTNGRPLIRPRYDSATNSFIVEHSLYEGDSITLGGYFGFKTDTSQAYAQLYANTKHESPTHPVQLLYSSAFPPPYPVDSVNSKTGAVVLTADNVGAVPTTRKVNGKPLSSDVALTADNVGAVPTTRTVNGKELSEDVTLTAADVGAPTTTAFEETARQALVAYGPNNQPPYPVTSVNGNTGNVTIPAGTPITRKVVTGTASSDNSITVALNQLPGINQSNYITAFCRNVTSLPNQRWAIVGFSASDSNFTFICTKDGISLGQGNEMEITVFYYQ